MVLVMTAPSLYSKTLPTLQTAWDATSLKSLMFCPRRYQQEIINGYRGSAIDLEFGILFATSMETFLKALLAGRSKEEATLEAVKIVLEESGQVAGLGTWIPWGGTYVEQWHCSGTQPFKNAKGNKAKCPFSHKGRWFMEPIPSICGECGSEIEKAVRYLPTDPVKNRKTLVRLVVWYCDEQVSMDEEGVKPYAFPDGTPAVELSFKIPLPYKTPDGEPFILCGHLDALKTFGDEVFPSDNKTSKKTITKSYWAQWSPHVQVDTYDLATSLMFPDLPIGGVMIEGAQTMVNGARFGRGIMRRSEPLREEFLKDLEYWLGQAVKFAKDDYWPMNRANCWLCPFKGICSKEPDKRKMYLDADFEVRQWNPLEER